MSTPSPAPQRVCIIGYGRAGAARHRACLSLAASSPHLLSLPIAITSRRPEHCTLDISSAFAAPVTAVLVCTESERHQALCGAALAAQRHVCVEYPLATSTAGAASVLEAWRASPGVVLHVEHIEFKSVSHFKLKALALGSVAVLRLKFTGSPLAGVACHPAFAGVARLTRMWDVAGELKFNHAEFKSVALDEGGKLQFKLDVALSAACWPGLRLEWSEERGPGLKRDTVVQVVSRDGLELELDEYLKSVQGVDVDALLATRDGSVPSFEVDTRDFLVKCAAADAAREAGESPRNEDAELELEMRWLTLAQEIADAAPLNVSPPHPPAAEGVAAAVSSAVAT